MGTAQMSTISVELRTTLVYKCNYKPKKLYISLI